MNWSLISIFFSLLLTPFFVYSQVDSIQLQINQDVWYPFMESYASFNDKEFMSIHTDDIIRISRDGQRIQVGEEYAKSMAENAKRNKESIAAPCAALAAFVLRGCAIIWKWSLPPIGKVD